jgi:ketosteroid isomerase-like protein
VTGVTPADLDHVRAFFASFDERIAQMREGVIEPHYSRYYSDDHVMEMPDAFPSPGSFVGLDGYRTWFEEAYSPWEAVVWELESLEVVNDVVVAGALVHGRPVGEDVQMEVRLTILYEVRDGRIWRSRIFLSRDRALEAARDGA